MICPTCEMPPNKAHAAETSVSLRIGLRAMARSFLTRLVDSVAQFLLVPSLLVCFACATPFPFEDLEQGMTGETVREEIGAPKATEAGAGTGESCWTYWHEEQNWVITFFPLSPFFILVNAVVPGAVWNDGYVGRSAVLLFFREEKLVRWKEIGPVWGGDPNDYDPIAFPDPPVCSAVSPSSYGVSKPVLPEVGHTGYVARNQVPLWSAPMTSSEASERRAFLDRDQPVKLIEEKDQWCHVEDDAGSDGWIRCVFLTASTPR